MSIGLRAGQLRALAGLLGRGRPLGGPPQVSLHLTNRCNIRCGHCYFYSPRAEAPNRLEVRRARKEGRPEPPVEDLAAEEEVQADAGVLHALIEEAVSLGTRRIHFSGYGEPFVHRDCLGLMEHAGSLGAYCDTDTNGTLLDAATAGALLDMGFGELRVTTLAGRAEAYARTHARVAPGGFAELEARLKGLVELKRARGLRRPVLRLVCIVFSENTRDLPDFARFACEVGADSVAFRPFDSVDDPGLAALLPTAGQAEEARRGAAQARAILGSAGVPHNIDRFLSIFSPRLDTGHLYRTMPCYYGWFVMRVDVDGTVYPCCRCYTALGNAAEAGIGAVWHSEQYRRFRREGLELASRGTPVSGCECGSCVHYETNLSVFRLLRPFRARSLRPGASDGREQR
jgi:MoaA/NifB/PqqE/SkfB family radical SAM enzyme